MPGGREEVSIDAAGGAGPSGPAFRGHLTPKRPCALYGHMTMPVFPYNDDLIWFFTDPESRYTLQEVVHLTNCSKDDIQNWVRRGMITPDETTPGRRIYLPATVAMLRIAGELRFQGESANHALMHGHLIMKAAFRWFAGEDVPDGQVPSFEKDFRQHYAALVTYDDLTREPPPPEPGLLPGIALVGILHRSKADEWLDYPSVRIVRLHWMWLNLAWAAKTSKDRKRHNAQRARAN